MAQSAFTGPIISLGGFAGAPNGGPPAEYSVEIGPSIFWQGSGLLAMDGRGSKDKKGMGAFPALFMSDTILALNQVLQPAGLALTVPANASSGVNLPLATTYAAGIAPGTPFSGALGVGIETGFAVGTATNGSPTIAVAANDKWRFSVGQFVSLAGAGPAGSMLMAKVLTIGGAGVNSFTISPSPSTSNTVAIGTYGGDPSGYGFVLPTSYSPFMNGGAGRFLLPDCGAARGVGVVGVAGGAAGGVLIQGLDVYMRPQSEIISAAAGAGTTYGHKTYKVLLSATPQFTSANNYSVVTSDLIGLPLSVLPNQPPPDVKIAGVEDVGEVFQYADVTNPATTSTGDPRGGVQLSAAGPNAGATGAGPDGTSRITIEMTLNPAQVLSANQFNPGALFGVHPV
jgi:hypothetical protein